MSEHDIADRQALHFVAARIAAADKARVAARAGGDSAVDRISCRLGDGSCVAAHAASISRAASGRRSSIQRSLLRLQAQYGNRYVCRVLRQAGAAEAGGGDMDAIERSIDQARGGGQAMDHRTRAHMERTFGADFSGVRIHADTRADGLSQSLSARAFTTGRDVFFRQGEYNPGSLSGRELLAHELTHVVQQNGDGIQREMTVSEPGDARELEADRMARAVIEQEHAPGIDRQTIPPQEEEEKPRVAMQRATDFLQRQPEAPTPQEEEERKKRMLQTKQDMATGPRREDRPAPE
jgi:hypothetical protein